MKNNNKRITNAPQFKKIFIRWLGVIKINFYMGMKLYKKHIFLFTWYASLTIVYFDAINICTSGTIIQVQLTDQ